MSVSRFEAEKFFGKNDFGLWRLKMRAMLIQQGLADALKPVDKSKNEDPDLDPKEKAKRDEIFERAHSAIILNLGDKVLREVARETTAAGVWAKLESLYMTKSLANRLYVKQRLYSFKIMDEKGVEEQLDSFNKIIDDLENIDVKLEDEDKAIILSNALPKSFEQLKDVMLYGRETSITMEEVQSALKSKELQKQGSKVSPIRLQRVLLSKVGRERKISRRSQLDRSNLILRRQAMIKKRRLDHVTIARSLGI